MAVLTPKANPKRKGEEEMLLSEHHLSRSSWSSGCVIRGRFAHSFLVALIGDYYQDWVSRQRNAHMALINDLKWVIFVQDDFSGSSGRHQSNSVDPRCWYVDTLSRQEFSIQGPQTRREIPPIFRPDGFFILTRVFNLSRDRTRAVGWKGAPWASTLNIKSISQSFSLGP